MTTYGSQLALALGHDQLLDKFRGALVGAAVGDALGAAFEGHPGPVPIEGVGEAERGEYALPYTDDTAMTIALAESLLQEGGLNQDRLVQAFARSWQREPHRGYGAGTAGLLARIAAGATWEAASRAQFEGQGSFGNGAAMRVAPVALFAAAHPARTSVLARRSASVTHAHPLAIDGAAVQAAAVATALAHPASQPLAAQDFLADVHAAVTEPVFAERLSFVASLVPDATAEQVGEQLGTGVAAHEAVPAALLSFLRHPASYPDAVRFAITLGGDTDTIASMAGAVAGACLGVSAIPERWVERTEGAGTLRALAERLASRVLAATG